MYYHTIYHHSDSYYALEFGVILNFVWVLRSRFFLKKFCIAKVSI